MCHFGLVHVWQGDILFITSTAGCGKSGHLTSQFRFLAFWAERSFFSVDRGGEEVKDHMAILAVKFIYWHFNLFHKGLEIHRPTEIRISGGPITPLVNDQANRLTDLVFEIQEKFFPVK